MFVESFSGFFSTLFTLVYVSLGVEDTSTLESFEDGSLLHLWANLLFVSYIGITMLILLNILIAMMNSSYQVIAPKKYSADFFSRKKLVLPWSLGSVKNYGGPEGPGNIEYRILDLFFSKESSGAKIFFYQKKWYGWLLGRIETLTEIYRFVIMTT